jgi:hypothetical protein
VTSREDLRSFHEREVADAVERTEKTLERMMKGGRVSVLDLMPDDLGRMLREAGSYAYWIPPGSLKDAKERPLGNLGAFLSGLEVRGAERIIVPLNVVHSKAEFEYGYGLSEELGITFEDFSRLVEDGRLVLVLSGGPHRYGVDFYKVLFKACERAGYTPPFAPPRIHHFMSRIKLDGLAEKERIPREEGWVGGLHA